jgi:transporter family protein
MSWLLFAILSAISAAWVSMIGLQDIDSNTATAIRAVIMSLFLFGVVTVQGNLERIPEIIGDKKALFYIILSGVAGLHHGYFTSWRLNPERYYRLRLLIK